MVGDDFEDCQHIKQDRQLELIGKRISELRCARAANSARARRISSKRVSPLRSVDVRKYIMPNITPKVSSTSTNSGRQDKLNGHGPALVLSPRKITIHGSDSSGFHA